METKSILHSLSMQALTARQAYISGIDSEMARVTVDSPAYSYLATARITATSIIFGQEAPDIVRTYLLDAVNADGAVQHSYLLELFDEYQSALRAYKAVRAILDLATKNNLPPTLKIGDREVY